MHMQEWSNRCSGHGSAARDRKCKCQKPYYGRFCQYKNDCETDKDCNNQGMKSFLPRDTVTLENIEITSIK